jgi:hypothetical protein
VPLVVERASDAVEAHIVDGLVYAQNHYNGQPRRGSTRREVASDMSSLATAA